MYSVSTFFRLIQYKREGMQLHFHISRHIAHLGWETPVFFTLLAAAIKNMDSAVTWPRYQPKKSEGSRVPDYSRSCTSVSNFYLVYIWHYRIKLFLRHLPNCPCSNFSLYVDLLYFFSCICICLGMILIIWSRGKRNSLYVLTVIYHEIISVFPPKKNFWTKQ
jgi:hypothetical protein